MSAIELLQKARTRIEKGWIKGWLARDEYDRRVEVGDPRACKFSLSGAIYDESSNQEGNARVLLSCVLPRQYESFVHFNDDRHTSKEMVLDLIDKAIEYGKTRGV